MVAPCPGRRARRQPLTRAAVVAGLALALAVGLAVSLTGRPGIEDDPRLRTASPPPPPRQADWDDEDEDGLARAAVAPREAAARLGPDHLSVAAARLRLAGLHANLGRLDEAAAGYGAAAAALAGRGEPDHWIAREARARRAELDETGDAARARALTRAAAGHLRRGHYAEAVGPARQALALRQALPGAPRADVADSLLQLGRAYLNRDEFYRDARATLERARDTARDALGPGHPLYAACLHELGTLEEDQGDFFTADQLYTRALEVLAAARGEESADYARTLARQGRMHAAWWVSHAAGKVLRAQQIREQVLDPGHPDYAESLEDLARLALNNLDFARAEHLAEQALAVRERSQGPDHPDLAESLTLLGRTHERQGNFLHAHRCHRRALAHVARACGPGHLRHAAALSWAAWAHDQGLDNVRAARLYEQERITRAAAGADQHPDYAFCLFNLGSCLAWIESLNQLAYDNTGLLARPATPDRLFARGRALIDEAAAHLERLDHGNRLPAYVMYLTAPAWLDYYDGYRTRGLEETARVLARADDVIARYWGDRFPYLEHVYSGKARYLMATGDIDGARRAVRKYSDLVRDSYGTSHHRYEVARLGMMIEVEDRAGDFGSLDAAVRAFFDRNRELVGPRYAPIERTLIEWLNRNHRVLSIYVAAAAARPGADLTRPYGEVLAFRGEVASRQARLLAAARRPELSALRDRLGQARLELARAAFGPVGPDEQAWQEQLQTRIDAREDAEAELVAASFASGPPRPVDPEPLVRDVQRALPAGSVLVEYFRLKQPLPFRPGNGPRPWVWHLVAFVVHHDRPPEMVPLGPLGPIEEAAARWRARIHEGADPAAEGRTLAALVWAPLAPRLEGARSLYVVPDGPLCEIPLAALPGADGRLLVEDTTFSYLPAARMLAVPAGPAPARPGDGLLVVGGIDYGPGAGSADGPRAGLLGRVPAWAALPAAGEEAGRVAQLFSRAHPDGTRSLTLAGPEADVPSVLDRLGQGYRHIHFAGHGFFADPAIADGATGPGSFLPPAAGRAQRQTVQRHGPFLSGLVLAGANGPSARTDAARCYLPADRLGGLDLRGTDLVTLSACDTGLGQPAGGEGLLGLQRAFHAAGARHVVASLWKVNDAATSVLMEEFYTNLWQRGLTAREALRQAQLAVYRGHRRLDERERDLARRGLVTGVTKRFEGSGAAPAGGRGTSPEFWAAFILSGADNATRDGSAPFPGQAPPGRVP